MEMRGCPRLAVGKGAVSYRSTMRRSWLQSCTFSDAQIFPISHFILVYRGYSFGIKVDEGYRVVSQFCHLQLLNLVTDKYM